MWKILIWRTFWVLALHTGIRLSDPGLLLCRLAHRKLDLLKHELYCLKHAG